MLRRLARATGGEAFFPGELNEVVAICGRIARDIAATISAPSATFHQAPGRPAPYRSIRVVRLGRRGGRSSWCALAPATSPLVSHGRSRTRAPSEGRDSPTAAEGDSCGGRKRSFFAGGVALLAYCGVRAGGRLDFPERSESAAKFERCWMTEPRRERRRRSNRVPPHPEKFVAGGDRRPDWPTLKSSTPRPFDDRHRGNQCTTLRRAGGSYSRYGTTGTTGERGYFRAPRHRLGRPLRRTSARTTSLRSSRCSASIADASVHQDGAADNVAVLDPSKSEVLTLVT